MRARSLGFPIAPIFVTVDHPQRRDFSGFAKSEYTRAIPNNPRHATASGLTPGQRVGPYEVIAKLGAGGMGEVYRAHDTQLGRDVAIKILPVVFATDPERLTRFEREARVLASLNHPHIAAIYGIESDPGGPVGTGSAVRALVMELVQGPTLADRLARGPLPIQEALAIARQIAEALEAAHGSGIVHRDLKPANIKVTPDGLVKVLDFGLAKMTAPASLAGVSTSPTITTPEATRAGMVLGTPAYMSPEQVRGTPVDGRADVWAFGCVLYEMLTGVRAFDGDEVAVVLARILEADPDFTRVPEATPPSVQRLLRRCLVKDRQWRLPDMAMVRIELADASAPPVDPRRTAPNARRGVSAFLWGGGAALLAIIAALTAFTLERMAPDGPVTRLDVTTPPTFDPSSFALSPDGRQLVFVSTAGNQNLLWIRPLEEVTARPIAGTEGASSPFWSPGGEAIGFFAHGKLKTIDVRSGAAKELADAASGRGGAWNRDGVILYAPLTNATIMRVSAVGGTPTAVTSLTSDHTGHRWPQFLPDGRRFLFFVQGATGATDATGVYLASLDGGEPKQLLLSDTAGMYAPPGYLLHVSNGVLLAHRYDMARSEVSDDATRIAEAVGTREGAFRGLFSVSDNGLLAHRSGTGARRQLTLVTEDGKTSGVIGSPDPAVPSMPELSPDGRRIALIRGAQAALDIWIVDVSRGVGSRFTLNGGTFPIWSVDGERLFWNSQGVVFQQRSDGTGDAEIVLDSGGVLFDHSRDGRYLLYGVQSDIWALPLSGDRKPLEVAASRFDEGQGQFSPDGNWIAYASNDDDGSRHQVYVRSFPGLGPRLQVSTEGGKFPRWRHDGSVLYYIAPDERLMAAPIRFEAGAPTPIADAPIALFQTGLATGAYILESGSNARAQYDVARDGRFLMNKGVEEAAAPITIVQNWTTLLKQP